MLMKRSHVYRSLLRPSQFLGCDRELTMSLCLICALAAFACASLAGVTIAFLLFCAGFYALRRMSLSDPLAREVYLRSLRYARFYQAKPGIKRKNHA